MKRFPATCEHPPCARLPATRVHGISYCTLHAYRKKHKRDMDAPLQKHNALPSTCEHPECSRSAHARIKETAYCVAHHHRQMRGCDMDAPIQKRGKPIQGKCEHPGCNRPAFSRLRGNSVSYCQLHRRRLRDGIDMDAPLRPSPRWPIGATQVRDGYIYVKISEGNGKNNDWVRQHRLTMEQNLGRPLFPDETVHHKYGIRDDNRIENLELWSSSHPSGQRVEDKLRWAQEIIKRYTEQ